MISFGEMDECKEEMKSEVSEFVSEKITDKKLNVTTFYSGNRLLRFMLLGDPRIAT